MRSDVTPRENVSLSAFCSMEVGGPARYFVEARDVETVVSALDWADARGLPVRVLGGGSNLIVADDGVDGLVVKMALRGLDASERADAVEVTAAAGEPWDDLVRMAVERGWAGIECLSGIPGWWARRRSRTSAPTARRSARPSARVRVLDRRRGRGR